METLKEPLKPMNVELSNTLSFVIEEDKYMGNVYSACRLIRIYEGEERPPFIFEFKARFLYRLRNVFCSIMSSKDDWGRAPIEYSVGPGLQIKIGKEEFNKYGRKWIAVQ